jgi:hypothetical protein
MKLIYSSVILALVVGAAAFLAGRLLNRGVSPLGLFGPDDDGVSILPATELPSTPAEVEGLFVERQDNVILIEADQPVGDRVSGSPVGIGGGSKFEAVITTETLVYHDTTEPPARRPSGNDPRVIQQTVGEGTLDNLIPSKSLVMVWGRKSGDRIIAEAMVYLDLGMAKNPQVDLWHGDNYEPKFHSLAVADQLRGHCAGGSLVAGVVYVTGTEKLLC